MDIINQNLGKLYQHGLGIRCQDLKDYSSPSFIVSFLLPALAFNQS